MTKGLKDLGLIANDAAVDFGSYFENLPRRLHTANHELTATRVQYNEKTFVGPAASR
jgi:hypothetical protein